MVNIEKLLLKHHSFKHMIWFLSARFEPRKKRTSSNSAPCIGTWFHSLKEITAISLYRLVLGFAESIYLIIHEPLKQAVLCAN